MRDSGHLLAAAGFGRGLLCSDLLVLLLPALDLYIDLPVELGVLLHSELEVFETEHGECDIGLRDDMRGS
jgi:hypothetical protein